MKPKKIMSNTPLSEKNGVCEFSSKEIYNTPICLDAIKLDNKTKIKLISEHFKKIMQVLGLDLKDDSLSGTPDRVAKMYVEEIFSGLNPKNKPQIKLFENRYHYKEMLLEKNINFFSNCEHHFVPIEGKAHIAYIPSGRVIGLSKINRIVQYYAARPQVQERLTIQINYALKEVLQIEDVAVMIDSNHLCVSMRGIKDTNTTTITTHYSGKFKEESVKNEFLRLIQL